MKKLIAFAMLLPLHCKADEISRQSSDLSLLFTIVENKDKEVIARITIENTSQKPIRVVLPTFPPFQYWRSHANGGYGLAIIEKDGTKSEIPEPRVPDAAPPPIQEKNTIILQPGMSIGKLVQLRGALVEVAQESRLVAYYEIPVDLPRGLAMSWNDKLELPLWRGSITSSTLGMPKKGNDSSNKAMRKDADKPRP